MYFQRGNQMEKRSKEIYTAELKSEVVKLVLDHGQGVIAVSQRMGIPKATLSTWVNKAQSSLFASTQGIKVTSLDLEAENKRLKQALARAEMERDILKKATAYFAKDTLRGTHS